MVCGHIGRGDQNTGNTRSRDLITGGSACTADDNICRSHDRGHVVNVFLQENGVIVLDPLFFHPFGHPFPAETAHTVDMLEGITSFLLQGHQFGSHLIHRLGAQAAKSRQNHRTGVQAQFLTAGLLLILDEFAAHRHTHHLDLTLILIVTGTLGEANQHFISPTLHHAGGKSGNRIALMDTAGDFQQTGSHECGKAGVTASSHHNIRAEVLDDLLAPIDGTDQVIHNLHIFLDACKGQASGKTAARQSLQLEACLGHQLFFHAALCADKQDLAFGVFRFPKICHSDGRIDMSAGTAAGKNHIHVVSSRFAARFRLREIPSRIPISPRFAASAVPP